MIKSTSGNNLQFVINLFSGTMIFTTSSIPLPPRPLYRFNNETSKETCMAVHECKRVKTPEFRTSNAVSFSPPNETELCEKLSIILLLRVDGIL